MQSESIKELAAALAKAQKDIKSAIKDKSVNEGRVRYKWADLAQVWDACKDALNDTGISISQLIQTNDNGDPYLETLLIHESGEWLKSSAPLYAVKKVYTKQPNGSTIITEEDTKDPQALGSAITYMRRYSLAAIAGVAVEDDDGETATGKNGDIYEKNTPTPPKINKIKLEQFKSQLDGCTHLDELKTLWLVVPPPYKNHLEEVKNNAKDRLSKAS